MKAKPEQREIDSSVETEEAKSMAVFADLSRRYKNTLIELAKGSSDADRPALSPEDAAATANQLIRQNSILFKRLS